MIHSKLVLRFFCHELHVKGDKSTPILYQKDESYDYHRQLLKSELKAFCVVCNSFCSNVLYSILQQLLVPHVGLNQVVKACCLLHPGVKLQSRTKKMNHINSILKN